MHKVCESEKAEAESVLRRVTVNLPESVYEVLAARASAQDRTVSSYVRFLLRRDVQETASGEEANQ